MAGWADTVDATTLFLSAITVLELELGFLRVEPRSRSGAGPRRRLEGQVVREFADRILPLDADGARAAPAFDDADHSASGTLELIAATALVHGRAVVIRNVDDFLPHRRRHRQSLLVANRPATPQVENRHTHRGHYDFGRRRHDLANAWWGRKEVGKCSSWIDDRRQEPSDSAPPITPALLPLSDEDRAAKYGHQAWCGVTRCLIARDFQHG